MKMLGQDLFTQDEFDQFKQTTFDPLVSKVNVLTRWVTGLSFAVVVLVTTDILLFIK